MDLYLNYSLRKSRFPLNLTYIQTYLHTDIHTYRRTDISAYKKYLSIQLCSKSEEYILDYVQITCINIDLLDQRATYPHFVDYHVSKQCCTTHLQAWWCIHIFKLPTPFSEKNRGVFFYFYNCRALTLPSQWGSSNFNLTLF